MASGSPVSAAEPSELSAVTSPMETQDPEQENGNRSSELREPSALQGETDENAFQILAISVPLDDIPNPKYKKSAQQSLSADSLMTTEASVIPPPLSQPQDDVEEHSDNLSICSNIVQEEEEVSDRVFSRHREIGEVADNRLQDLWQEEVELRTATAETTDTSDDSSCQKSASEPTVTSQSTDLSSNSETSLLKDDGDAYVSEPGTSEGIRSRRGVSSAKSEGVLYQERSQQLLGQAESQSIQVYQTEIISRIIEFQIRTIAFMFITGLLLVKFAYKGVFHPIETFREAKGEIAEALGFVFEEIAWVWPLLKKFASKFSRGLLGGAYITFVLGFLLLPALVLDLLLIRALVEEPIQVKEVLLFNYSLPHPSAEVWLFSSGSVLKRTHFAEGDSVEFLSRQAIAAALHKLDVTVTLSLPESDHNMQLGVFQVSAELFSLNGQSLAKFYQPCMMQFYSTPVRLLRNMVTMIPTFLGFYDETQKHVLRLVHSYVDPQNHVKSVKISLEPRVTFKVGAGLPEIYSAEVLVQSELPLLKSIIYKFKLLIFIWIGSALFSMEVAVVFCCCRRILFPEIFFGRNSGHLRTHLSTEQSGRHG